MGTEMLVATTAIPWSNPEFSTPLADIRAVIIALDSNGVEWNGEAHVSQATADMMIGNKNAADVHGRAQLGIGGREIIDLDLANRILWSNGLPGIAVRQDVPDGVVLIREFGSKGGKTIAIIRVGPEADRPR